MSQYKVTMYQAVFHSITVDASDAIEAEKIAASYITKFPGSARQQPRALTRWHIEEIRPQPQVVNPDLPRC